MRLFCVFMCMFFSQDNPQEAGSATVPLSVTEQDAQTLLVDNEKLADLLGLREAEERGASAGGGGAQERVNREEYGFASSQLLKSSLGPGAGAAESRPSSSVESSSLLVPASRPRLVGGRAGAEEMGKARAGMQAGEGEAVVEDPVLKYLLEEFHPQYISKCW